MERRLIEQMAKRDAREYAYANTNYGKGAGNRRKIIRLRVEERKKNDIYRQAFDDEMTLISYEKMADRVEKRKAIEKTYHGTKKVFGLMYRLYNRNRDIFEPIVRRILG